MSRLGDRKQNKFLVRPKKRSLEEKGTETFSRKSRTLFPTLVTSIFVLRKNGSETKKRMKEEEDIERAIAGRQPEQSIFFEILSDLNRAVNLQKSPRRQESNALAGYTNGPSGPSVISPLSGLYIRRR